MTTVDGAISHEQLAPDHSAVFRAPDAGRFSS